MLLMIFVNILVLFGGRLPILTIFLFSSFLFDLHRLVVRAFTYIPSSTILERKWNVSTLFLIVLITFLDQKLNKIIFKIASKNVILLVSHKYTYYILPRLLALKYTCYCNLSGRFNFSNSNAYFTCSWI